MTRPNHVFLRVNSSHRHSNDSCFARNQELVWTLKRKTKYISNFPGMNVDATGPCSEPCVSKKVACFRPLVKLTSFLRSPHSLWWVNVGFASGWNCIFSHGVYFRCMVCTQKKASYHLRSTQRCLEKFQTSKLTRFPMDACKSSSKMELDFQRITETLLCKSSPVIPASQVAELQQTLRVVPTCCTFIT